MAGWIWLIITSILLILSAWILINIRKYCYRKNQFGKGSVKKIASWFDKGYGYVLLLYYILIFAGITTTFYFGLGMEDVFSGLVAGTAITSFIVIELPHLMKPNIVVVSLPAIKETKTYKDEPQTQVKIKLGGEELLFFKLTNAGTNNYLNCTFWFFFPEGIQPIQEPKFYEDLEYKKEFEIWFLGKPERRARGTIRAEPERMLSLSWPLCNSGCLAAIDEGGQDLFDPARFFYMPPIWQTISNSSFVTG